MQNVFASASRLLLRKFRPTPHPFFSTVFLPNPYFTFPHSCFRFCSFVLSSHTLETSTDLNISLQERYSMVNANSNRRRVLRMHKAFANQSMASGSTDYESFQLWHDTYIALRKLRSILSLEQNPPTTRVVSTGICTTLNTLLLHPCDECVFEAAWCITNVASGDSTHTNAVISAETVPVLIAMLQSPNHVVVEQCVWALGNIAGDSSTSRDLCVSKGALENLLPLVECGHERITNSRRELPRMTISILRNMVWTLANLVRGRPRIDLVYAQPVVGTISKLLAQVQYKLSSSSFFYLPSLESHTYDFLVPIDFGFAIA